MNSGYERLLAQQLRIVIHRMKKLLWMDPVSACVYVCTLFSKTMTKKPPTQSCVTGIAGRGGE